MGNSSSTEKPLRTRLHQRELKNMTWINFQAAMREMNAACKNTMEPNGDYLCFAFAKNSVQNVFWKQHVRVLCFKINIHTKQIVSCKVLGFEEFMNAYILRKSMSIAANMQQANAMNQSYAAEILAETADTDGSCVICMDNPNQILLPCLHAFCLVCVSQQMEFRTPFRCPVCRTAIQKPIEDSWEVADIPQPHEVEEYLAGIARSQE